MQNKFKLFRFQDNKTSEHKNIKNSKLKSPAFSLQEIIIVVAIVVIIAAILIFALINSNDKKYTVGLKQANDTIGRAFGAISAQNAINPNMTTEDFTKKVLSKYIKLKKACKNPKACGFPEKITRPDGSVLEALDIPSKMTSLTEAEGVTEPINVKKTKKNKDGTMYAKSSIANNTTKKYNKAYYFITQNGYHVMFFYNPYCVSNPVERPFALNRGYENSKIQQQLALDTACLWGVYDMNGTKEPNQVGKDIGFVGSFYRGKNTKLASVLPASSELVPTTSLVGGIDHAQRAIDYCKSLDGDKYKLPNINELSLLYLNSQFLINRPEAMRIWLWSSSELPYNDMSNISWGNGHRAWINRMHDRNFAYCIKRMPKK